MLLTQSLQFSYPNSDLISFPDLSCQGGKSLLVLGSSGIGKTTLLHLLAGILKPKNGKIIIGDTEVSQLNSIQSDHFRGNHIGLIFQQAHFISGLNLKDNLLMTQYLAKRKQDLNLIKKTLDRLNLSKKLNAKPNSLSQGEKQRAAIARAVLNSPDVILADEPTSALDDENCTEVIHLLEEHARVENAALVIVTHDGRLKDRINNQVILAEKVQ